MRIELISLVLCSIFLLPVPLAAQLVGKPATIYGESFVNLRSGPDLSYPAQEILREGQEVWVERRERGWYLVVLPDGRHGYVHQTLIRFSGESVAKEKRQTEEAKLAKQTEGTRQAKQARETKVTKQVEETKVTKQTVAPRAGQEKGKELPSRPPPHPAAQTLKGRPLPVITLLEGREWEVLGWFGVALCIFLLGWICGGNYYLRRDRIKRTKLHF